MTTSMKRTISIAGTLAAALGSALTLSPANAANVTAECTFANATGATTGTCADAGSGTPFFIQLGDKLFNVITAPTSGSGKVSWSYSSGIPGFPDLWQTDLDWDDPGILGAANGKFEYTEQITAPGYQFDTVALASGGKHDNGINEVTKSVYAGLNDTGTLLATLNSIDGASIGPVQIGGTSIFVRDTWSVPQGNVVDNVINYTTQRVPGPLPLMGAAVALGFSRRLRRRMGVVS